MIELVGKHLDIANEARKRIGEMVAGAAIRAAEFVDTCAADAINNQEDEL